MVSKIAIFTVEEAARQWCPSFRGNDHGINRPLEIENPLVGRCLGPRCMAWRWYETHVKTDASFDLVKDGETYGYCGQFGSPAPVGDA